VGGLIPAFPNHTSRLALIGSFRRHLFPAFYIRSAFQIYCFMHSFHAIIVPLRVPACAKKLICIPICMHIPSDAYMYTQARNFFMSHMIYTHFAHSIHIPRLQTNISAHVNMPTPRPPLHTVHYPSALARGHVDVLGQGQLPEERGGS